MGLRMKSHPLTKKLLTISFGPTLLLISGCAGIAAPLLTGAGAGASVWNAWETQSLKEVYKQNIVDSQKEFYCINTEDVDVSKDKPENLSFELKKQILVYKETRQKLCTKQ